MTDREYRLAKVRVQKYVRKWCRAMGLGWWNIVETWNRDTIDHSIPGSQMGTATTTHTDWKYQHADIHWNLDVIAQMLDD